MIADSVASALIAEREGAATAFPAFGLTVRSDLPLAGVDRGGYSPGPETFIERLTDAELTSFWSARHRARARRPPDASARIEIHYDEELGYLLDLPDAGRFSVSRDGRLIRFAPADVESWRWQRGLFAGPLPFAALAQGIEVFHASAVVLDGRVIAITGESGAGKTSLATFLRLAGARFFSDDVLALERRAHSLVAHPGPPLVNLRQSTSDLLSSRERARLGAIVGQDRFEIRLATKPFEWPAPVAALYFIERRPDAERLSFEPVREAPRWLLASSYNFVIRTPERLVGQLDLCSRLAERACLTRIVIPADVDARTLAAAVFEHVGSIASPSPLGAGAAY